MESNATSTSLFCDRSAGRLRGGTLYGNTAAIAGAHIITIPPQFLPKMVDHKYTRLTVGQFVDDADKALKQIALAKVAAQ